MKIHVLAQRTDLTPSAIRFYEKEGLLDARHVQRGQNNYRDYYEEAVEHLLMIRKVQAVGFTLAELKEVIQAYEVNDLPLSKKIELLNQKMQEIDRKKDELEQVHAHLARMLANKMALMDSIEKGSQPK
ncbi:MerR family transcriptional regulator [Paenibacillus sp. PR3]|uniref:MerR family transcriptional regulator n=1 Tax=Paenibacillus terricola TaxID=2763503 RepID=A0ABR8MMV2_9BACL|nr:MerR family transcriptional regulator [Paenibacillus terricola]MBD3917342.1 MerR family transcriptional regulator [Paenibacillus terricola]